MNKSEKRQLGGAAWRDLFVISLAAFAAFVVAIRLKPFEAFNDLIGEYSFLRVNDLATALVLLTVALALISWRRSREVRNEVGRRRNAEDSLRVSEESYKQMVEQAEEIIFRSDTHGLVTFCNPAAARILKYPESKLIGSNCLDLVRADFREATKRFYKDQLLGRTGSTYYEFTAIDNEGGEVQLGQNVQLLIEKDRIVGFQAVARDLTERKRSEEAQVTLEINKQALTAYERLVERIAALGQTLGNARDLTTIFRTLREFCVVSVPCDGMVITLYDSEKSTRKLTYCWADDTEFDPKDLDELPVGDGITGRAIKSGSVVIGNDYQQLIRGVKPVSIGAFANGELPKSALSAPMTVMGRTVGCVEIQSYKLGAYNREHETAMLLAASLAATAVENVSLIERERLKEDQLRQSQKMEAIGQLAGGVAHDFNNLLTVITGYSELSLRRLSKDDPLRTNIEGISKAGKRAAGLTRQLLAFSRRQMLQSKVLDLNHVVEEMDKLLQRLIGADVDLVTVLHPGLGQIKADPGQIEQVVMNLVVNARDALPKGGRITIETGHATVDEAYTLTHVGSQAGRYVVLAVTDNGIGMDAEIQKRVFEPFFTTKEVGKGTGLGLSTVYGIVKQSEGSIWVSSEPGKGTTFKIYLPRIDEGKDPEDAALETAAPGGSETVLLVEDEDMVRDLSREILEQYGYKVIAASNGAEGLRICKEFEGRIDLLITDVVMPQMSGRELSEYLPDLRPETKVLFMSGYTDDAVVRHGILDEHFSFLKKPFLPDVLARKAREVLDRPA